ncbi:MAG: hypothetical protein SGJ20_14235 [Planctomycetota bacterium]|nr:hypothetical protein [Planctomycetota bacterium]
MRALGLLATMIGLPLLGILANMPIDQVSNMTATAMLGWYVWHTSTRTLPELVADFRAELAIQRAEHRENIELLCSEINTEIERRRAEQQELLAAIGKRCDR